MPILDDSDRGRICISSRTTVLGVLRIDGMGDGIVFASFTMAADFRSVPVVFAAVFIACFTDERALIAAPLIAVAALSCASLRNAHAIGNDFGVGIELIVAHGLRIHEFIAASLVVLDRCRLSQWRHRQWGVIVVTSALVVGVIAVALAVSDVDRSLAYLLPVIFISYAAAARYYLTIRNARDITIVAFLVSFIASIRPSYLIEAAASPFPVEMARLIHYSLK